MIHVFIDANFFISTGKSSDHALYQQLKNWVDAELIKVVTTSHTKLEIIKKFSRDDATFIKDIARGHFRQLTKELTGIELPDISKEAIEEHFWKTYEEAVDVLFKSLGAIEISIDDVQPSDVLNDYAKGKGFFAGTSKKDQFPDAFIFQALKTKLDQFGHLVILTNDGDYDAPSGAENNVTVVKDLAALAGFLGIAESDLDIEPFLEDHDSDVRQQFAVEIERWGLNVVDVEDAIIEEIIEVTGIEFSDLNVLGKFVESEQVLVLGTAQATVKVSYQHPNWDTAAYDSEDKILIPWEDVSGEKEIEIDIDFSMIIDLDEDGNATEIESVDFTDDRFVWVDLYPYDPWEYV